MPRRRVDDFLTEARPVSQPFPQAGLQPPGNPEHGYIRGGLHRLSLLAHLIDTSAEPFLPRRSLPHERDRHVLVVALCTQ
jgi:hypothetical protein